ncbi:MAG: hypothetical protein HY289_04150 [Planctomycetes bacterium]|nr:hypothetical protein [Planctomycetota bacterium]
MLTKNARELRFPSHDDGIIELSLMMSRRQFEALEERARAEDLSVAQFLRRLVHDAVADDLISVS